MHLNHFNVVEHLQDTFLILRQLQYKQLFSHLPLFFLSFDANKTKKLIYLYITQPVIRNWKAQTLSEDLHIVENLPTFIKQYY